MHYKRVIPCLDVDRGRVVKGIEFVDIRDAGDPVQLAARYDAAGADELVFLDITATSDSRDTVVQLARRAADELFIPFTIGGGIRSVADAQAVLDAGADKVSVNSAALARPELITELAGTFGSQSSPQQNCTSAHRAADFAAPLACAKDRAPRAARCGGSGGPDRDSVVRELALDLRHRVLPVVQD